jgi:predicted CXXCH cytochrome family protein
MKTVLWSLMCVLAVVTVLTVSQAYGLGNSDCLDCHGEPDFAVTRDGKQVSLYVNDKEFAASVHADNGCLSCHQDAGVAGDEHPSPLAPVNCGKCHENVEHIYDQSVHGRARARKDPFAPHCYDCHTKHSILPSSNKKSSTFILQIPFTCGSCHKEGTAMTRTHNIPRKNILKNYSMSIHGEALFRMGLTVTAVCTSCHTAHDILRPENPKSSISRRNVVKTCMKCHVNIEAAHAKIIRGELWEKEPNKIPVCVECHSPHKARRVLYEESMNDAFCLNCHSNPTLEKSMADGTKKSLFVNIDSFKGGIHQQKRIPCVKCHVNVSQEKNPVCKDSGPVDCSICHAEEVSQYQQSIHGQLHDRGDPNAATCEDCHGTHRILPQSDLQSPTFVRNVPDLCAECHRQGEKAAIRYKGREREIIKRYKMSIHGKGLNLAGLMVSATCTSCHTAHSILPASDSRSTVNRGNIISTCASCHLGIAERFRDSVHSRRVTKTAKKLPVCIDCHSSHAIERVDTSSFRMLILQECGNCHQYETQTYFETYHGRASLLSGGAKAAKCSDCHGAHDILPAYYSKSRLNRRHIVATCRKCHPDSNRKFTGYLTHATHHDKNKYPYLFYTFWAMTTLLVGTFAFFGLHTFFWALRSFRERFKKRRKITHEKIFKED